MTDSTDAVPMPEKLSPRAVLFTTREDLNEDALAIMREKNATYAAEDDPIRNYRMAAMAANTTPAHYIAGRMAEKLARLGNLLGTGRSADVNEEARDLMNLSALVVYADEEDR
jgi:hypothetical protein